MYIMKKSILVLMSMFVLSSVFMSNPGFAQDKKKKNYEEVQIQTSAVCGMCKERIEGNMAYEKGVKSVELNDETKVVTIGYDPRKTNPDNLRTAISKIGYDADNVAADPVAYEKLPGCCKKDNKAH
jgi:periplasmic mercuric ion binding protein